MKDLNVCGMLDNSLVNGKGMRFVLFLAGCPHHCPGCQNMNLQAYDSGEPLSVDAIFKKIEANMPIIDGVTLSGGEPFEQDATELLKMVKSVGLSVWVYTGYTYSELQELSKTRSYINEMLTYIDVIVDGKFEKDLTEGAPRYVGSTNQHFILLNNGDYVDTLTDYENKE